MVTATATNLAQYKYVGKRVLNMMLSDFLHWLGKQK